MEDFYVQLMNNYLEYYKVENNINYITLFDNIDIDDDLSTNVIMEDFYNEMIKYKNNLDDYIKIYDHDKININKDVSWNGIYVNNELQLVSRSLFALLIEITNLKNENKEIFYFIKNLTN